MSIAPSDVLQPQPQSQPERVSAYTTSRSDVFDLVPPSAKAILDVGCSNGALGLSLMQAVPGRSVCGIEFDPEFAREAATRLELVVNGDLNQLDWQAALGGRRFDCIIFADVLEHLVDPRQCMAQARQHLLPGGCVVVSFPNIRHISALWAIFIQGRFPRNERGIFDQTHLRWFTIADSHRFLAESGFRVSSLNSALRWRDQGGGRLNRLLNRLPASIRNWSFIREFFTYQISLRAEL